MDNSALDVLKWVGVAFAAGFIGYFGRYLAMHIIGRMRRKRVGEAPEIEPATEAPVSPEVRLAETQLKVEKKRAKAAAKKAKKEQKG